MNKAPSIYSATVILAVFLCLGMIPKLSYACAECLCFADNNCAAGECGPNFTTNCTRTEFTVDCNATYTLYTKVVCGSGSNCFKCMSCATLFSINSGTETYIADIHNNGCNSGSCVSSDISVSLSTTKTYVMYVCKVPCPDGASTCENCAASCTAYACLHYGVTSCTP